MSATGATRRKRPRFGDRLLDYFAALKIGHTATPAAHTVAFFKDVVYRNTTGAA